jgi:hypothetical protein
MDKNGKAGGSGDREIYGFRGGVKRDTVMELAMGMMLE